MKEKLKRDALEQNITKESYNQELILILSVATTLNAIESIGKHISRIMKKTGERLR